MSLTHGEIRRVVQAAGPLLLGARMQQWRQPEGTQQLVLQARAPGHTHQLVIQIRPRAAGLWLDEERYANAPVPTAFLMKLRKETGGRPISALALDDNDRIVRLQWPAYREEPTDPPATWTLLCELTGHHPNAFLLDEHGRIVVQAEPNRSKLRSLWPGANYEPPVSPPAPDSSDRLGDDSTLMQSAAALCSAEASGATADSVSAARKALQRALRKQARKVAHIWADLERAEGAEAARRQAELLKPVAHGLPRGTRFVDVVDYFDPELPTVRVELDPSLSAAETIAQLFHQARRLQDARAGIEARWETAEERRQALADALDAFDASPPAAEDAWSQVERAGVLRPTPQVATRSEAERRQVYREFVSADGTAIWVGKGAKENDTLTLRIAKSEDIWLHATGRTGAHVIVRSERGQHPSVDTLMDAAALAAWYADGGKHDRAVEVAYTRRKHVHKRKGFAPGMVTISNVKTIFVTPTDAQMDRLFGRDGFGS